MMRINKLQILHFTLVIFISLFSHASHAATKIILDTDLHHFADDHEAFVMLATLHKRKKIELLGVTLVAGNDWLEQFKGDALKAVERVKLEKEVPIYLGANQPLRHTKEFYEEQKKLYGIIYAGAWEKEKISSPPPDGHAQHTKAQDEHAVEFIIRSIRQYPGEITIVALGPLTNLALAFRQAPDIVRKIKSILYMGGAFYVAGNSNAVAEFNWWFDAEAAAIVLAKPIKHTIVPLDATNRILFKKKHYDKWTSDKFADHFMSQHFLVPKFKTVFEENPEFSIPVWDALVPAYLFDPHVVKNQRRLYTRIDKNHGPSYGNTVFSIPGIINHGNKHPHASQQADVILEMDEVRFWEIYEELIFTVNN